MYTLSLVTQVPLFLQPSSHFCWLLLFSIFPMQVFYIICQRPSPPFPCKFRLKSTIIISKCFLFTSLNISFSISSCYNDLYQNCLAQSQYSKAPSLSFHIHLQYYPATLLILTFQRISVADPCFPTHLLPYCHFCTSVVRPYVVF